MKAFLFLLIGFLPALTFAQKKSPYAEKFWTQISATCTGASVVLEKSIEETGEDATHGLETHTYEVDCARAAIRRTDTEAPGEVPGFNEFHFLFEYNCYNSYIKDYFDFNEEKGVVATLKDEYAGETPLQRQVFETDAQGTLRYAEAHVLKENMLYDLEVKIKVWFSAAGRYERHEIETYTRPSLKGGVRTIIRGRVTS